MAEVGSAFVSLLPSAKGFGRRTEQQIGPEVDGAGKRIGLGFGKAFGAAAVAIGGAKVVGFIGSSISAASDLNEAGTKTQAVFGKAGTAIVNDFAAKGAKALGQTKLQVLDAAATFGTFGKAAGKSGPELAKFSTGLVGLSTDLASFFNTSPAEAAEAISSGLRGEAEPLRKYGVLLDDATLRSEALKQGLIKTTKDALTPQQKVLAAQAVIMKQTKTAQGDFARTSGGLANQQRILSAQFGNFKTTLGGVFLPLAVKAVTFANKLFGSMDKLAPIFDTVRTAVSNAFASFSSGGGGGASSLLTTFKSIGQSVADNFLPVLSTMATTFRTVILPAITALVQYLVANLVPIFQQVAGIVTGTLLPILASLAQFFYGKVYPAVIAIVAVVAKNLKPVFDQLFASIQTQILPAVQRLLVKFQQWQPTLQRVAIVVLKVVGFVLKLASAILGKVLPVVIRFAAFLIGKLLGAIGIVISILVALVKGVFAIGRAFVGAIKFADRFGDGVRKAIGKVVTLFTNLPGKITGALSGAAEWLVDIGGDIVRGLVSGIGKLKNVVVDALLDLIPGPLKKFAGKLGIASPSKVFAKYGEALPEGLAEGIRRGGKHATKALQKLAEQLTARFSSLKESIAGIASGVADAFRPDLFSGTLTNLISGLASSMSKLPSVLAAVRKLSGEGIGGAFLQQLFASGNSELILSLASGSAAQVQQMQSQFNAIQSLTGQIGQAVANKSPEALELVKVNAELVAIKKELKTHPVKNGRETANALNHTAAAAKRRKTKAGSR